MISALLGLMIAQGYGGVIQTPIDSTPLRSETASAIRREQVEVDRLIQQTGSAGLELVYSGCWTMRGYVQVFDGSLERLEALNRQNIRTRGQMMAWRSALDTYRSRASLTRSSCEHSSTAASNPASEDDATEAAAAAAAESLGSESAPAAQTGQGVIDDQMASRNWFGAAAAAGAVMGARNYQPPAPTVDPQFWNWTLTKFDEYVRADNRCLPLEDFNRLWNRPRAEFRALTAASPQSAIDRSKATLRANAQILDATIRRNCPRQ